MKSKELLERLLRQYETNFDIDKNFEIDGHSYDALAKFNATSARYVLVKKAELWQAHCYEYILFQTLESLTEESINKVLRDIESYVEPTLVRKGEKYPEKDHMYSYMTVIFLVDSEIQRNVIKKLEKSKLYINYKMAIRGYSELRLIAVDTCNNQIYTNKAAKKFRKEIKKLF